MKISKIFTLLGASGVLSASLLAGVSGSAEATTFECPADVAKYGVIKTFPVHDQYLAPSGGGPATRTWTSYVVYKVSTAYVTVKSPGAVVSPKDFTCDSAPPPRPKGSVDTNVGGSGGGGGGGHAPGVSGGSAPGNGGMLDPTKKKGIVTVGQYSS